MEEPPSSPGEHYRRDEALPDCLPKRSVTQGNLGSELGVVNETPLGFLQLLGALSVRRRPCHARVVSRACLFDVRHALVPSSQAQEGKNGQNEREKGKIRE